MVACLNEYISQAELNRADLDGNGSPHKPMNYQSIASYIKLFIELSGIDVTVTFN